MQLMRRIDEATYIGALATCSDYQLFIDENNHSHLDLIPYHWISYRYPEGFAHYPILGMSFGNAERFCEWLTKRDDKGWIFRLPTIVEAKQNPINSDPRSLPLGYWAIGENQIHDFAWTSFNQPNTVIPIDFEVAYIFNDLRARADKIKTPTIEYIKPFERIDVIYRREFSFLQWFRRRLRKPIDRFKDELYDIYYLAEKISNLSAISDNMGFEYRFNQLQQNIQNLIYLINSVVPKAHLINRGLADDLADACKKILGLEPQLSALQERIAGRSPAFEGIRLVKERIK